MHDSLINYIRNLSLTPLSESDIGLIKELFVPKKNRKRQYFLQEGEVCKCAAFIVKGAMREYSVDDKGVEQVNRLFVENWWVSDRESYIMLTPSEYNIEAWEDCDLLLIKRTDQDRLVTIPAITEMIRKIDEGFAIATQKRLVALKLPAEKRYAELIKLWPELLQRFPQHIIASYLGITKETLSRIRSQSSKK